MQSRPIYSLVFFIALVFLVEWTGALFTSHSVTSWYVTLHKPAWNPPSWVFGPVWTVLYLAIGISGWLIFRKTGSVRKHVYPFAIYGLQLVCNLLWSYFFFFLKSPFLALLDILILIIFISTNIVVFAKISRAASICLLPYLIWTVYAATLNAAIWSLNR